MQVEVDAIVDRHLISRMRDAIAQLGALIEEWSSAPEIPEIDWSRMRALEFQEILRERTRLVERSRDSVCLHCPDFGRHVSRSRRDCIAALLRYEPDGRRVSTELLDMHERLRWVSLHRHT